MDTQKVKAIWILSITSLFIGYSSTCQRKDEQIVLDFDEHHWFTLSSSSGLGTDQIERMLNGSLIPFSGPMEQNVSVTFQVDKETPIFFTKICMYMRCAMKIIADYYGPWTSDSFFDITKRKKWIGVPPTHFSDEKSFQTCRRKKVCFTNPGILTNFTLTFVLHRCRSCSFIRVRNLLAKGCPDILLQLELQQHNGVILDSRNHNRFDMSSQGIQLDQLPRMLKESGEFVEAASGVEKFSVTFEVKNKGSLEVVKICVTTTCVQMIKMLLYGPWTKVSFKDWTGAVVWIEVPPVEFPDEERINNACSTTETCFISLGSLTKFNLTFEVSENECNQCNSIRIEDIYAEGKVPIAPEDPHPRTDLPATETSNAVTTSTEAVESSVQATSVASTVTATPSVGPTGLNGSSTTEDVGSSNTTAITMGFFQNTEGNSSVSVVEDTLSSIITVGTNPMIVPVDNSSETLSEEGAGNENK